MSDTQPEKPWEEEMRTTLPSNHREENYVTYEAHRVCLNCWHMTVLRIPYGERVASAMQGALCSNCRFPLEAI